MWVMAGMAVASMYSSHSQRKAQMKAKAADARLQRARLERARVRSTEDYVANSQRAREATQKREVQIESNRLDAESKIDETFAGSGISGTSVSELDNELNATVQRNKLDNKKALDDQLSDLSRNFTQGMEESAFATEQIDTTKVKGNLFNDLSKAASAAQSGASLSSDLKGAFQGSARSATVGSTKSRISNSGGTLSPSLGINF